MTIDQSFQQQLTEVYQDKYFLYKQGAFDHGWTPLLWWHCIRCL